MSRAFLASVGHAGIEPPGVALKLSREAGLRNVARQHGLSVWSTASFPVVQLEGERGVVLGTVFSRGEAARIVAIFDREATDLLCETSGRHFTENYWGAYVSLIGQTGSTSYTAFRDPSGALPCYYIETENGALLSSDASILARARSSGASINWDHLPRLLRYADFPSRETGVADLFEMPAGFALNCRGPTFDLSQFWDPWRFGRPAFSPPGGDHVRDLRECVNACISAWSSCFDHVLLSVSGGLDSSIVAACVAATPTQLSCYTMATNDPDGDERPYARLLGEALSASLAEQLYDLEAVDISKPSSPHVPRPIGRPFTQSIEKFSTSLAISLGVDAMFDGNGGDHVFCSMHSASPIVDRWRSTRFRGLNRTVADVSRLTGISILEAIRHAISRNARAHTRYNWRGDERFLSPIAIAQSQAPPSHPWLDHAPPGLPGKSAHVAMLLRVQNYLATAVKTSGPQSVSPLLSQPIMEQCLAIPTWEWCQGGQDRSVARQAFAGSLPEAILRRTSKGGPDSFCAELFVAHRAALRELLLGGLLAGHRLLDTGAIEAALNQVGPVRGHDYLRLLSLADAEAWTRHWSN